MPDTKVSSEWSIQARAFRIPFTPFTHNFWALAAPLGGVVDQLHGLAFDPKAGTTKAIGNASHWLLAVHDPTITWSLQPNQPTVVCASGEETRIRRRWQAALHALPAINDLHLHYPNFWQHFYKMNSNSVFNTLGQIMGFAQPSKLLPTLAPGIKRIISQAIIDQYCYRPKDH